MLPSVLLLAFAPLLALGQAGSGEGQLEGPTSSTEAAGYSCDSSCQLPNCNCASTSPPGGLSPEEVPQFIVFTADDAVQSYTVDSVNQFLGHRQNPNGCQPKATFYTSLNYTNYTLVTDWYVAGNEVADHTMTHQGDPSAEEINGNLIALNALAGIPMKAIKGFRAPYLNFSVKTLELLRDAGFTYDSSATASIPVTDEGTDAFWPYTLDYGMANNCLNVEGLCRGEPKLPGFWEIPMYAFHDNRGVGGPHLMDPYLDAPNGGNAINDTATLEYMQKTFTDHYNNNRQPIGLYFHPIHLSANYPGIDVSQDTINMINRFLDWAQEQQNVWIVSSEQLLAWVQDPKPVSQLDQVGALRCSTPDVQDNICNGMPENQQGLLSHCQFPEFPFYTCYGCPVELPTTSNPNPEQNVPDGENARYRLPSNCSTPFWDPIEGRCICNSDECAFNDESRAIGPNGANLTGGGTGGGDLAAQTSNPYIPFNGNGELPTLPTGFFFTVIVGTLGAMLGTLGVVNRL